MMDLKEQMAKPIPVFSFVFAAYAATSGTEFASRPAPFPEAKPCDIFLTAWRKRAAHGEPLIAKVGLLKGATSDDLHFAARGSRDACDELWLDQIVETRLGFLGAIVDRNGLPRRVKPGQRLRFHQIHVLDWRWGDGTSSQPVSERRHPREMLADLNEIVGA